MGKRFLFFVCMFLCLHAFSQLQDDNRLLNQFIVMLQPGHNINEVAKEFPALQVKKCLSKQMNIWLVQRNMVADAEQFLVTLKAGKAIKLAQFNHHVQRRSIIPNDPYFNDQWNMMNTGIDGGVVGADIDATNAWAVNHANTTVTGDSIVVAIIDGYNGGGFDITHEDLNFFINHNEIPNNGIDDDGNGFVDDYYGWNVFDSAGDVQPMGNSDVHAMEVSGVASAIGNNGKGIAGVCWGASIMRVVGASDEEAQVVEAYDYVREMRRLYNATNGSKGAFVVSSNSSFGLNGGPGGARHTDYPIWCAMYDSMGAVGILSAAATANAAWDIDVEDDMPTGCPSHFLIAVTNTTNQDVLNTQAAWGDTTIDLGAPGTGIYSTQPGNTYGSDNGTSFASPHVAGTVAAMFAAACPQMLNDYKVYPDSIALIVKQMILSGTTRISGLYNKTVSGGRLNLYNAIQNLNEYNCNACNYTISLTTSQPTCSDSCNGSLALSVTPSGAYSFNWSNGDTGVSVINNLCPGIYTVTVTQRSTGCSQIKNGYLYKPDSIVVSSIHTIPAEAGDSGNIIVVANAGNYNLEYSLNGANYQQASTLVISNNGSYHVYIENGIGCVVERNITVTGVSEIAQHLDWSVFPNPANQQLEISLSAAHSSNITITINNILGQRVIENIRQVQAGVSTVTQNLSSLSAGTYFISLFDGNTTSTQRFVIAR